VERNTLGIAKDKLTEEQKREIEQLRQFVSRNRLTSRINSTQWRAAIDAVAGVEGYVPRYRLKKVTDVAEPPAEAWLGGFPAGLPLYNAIEWLELKGDVEMPGAGKPRDRRRDFRGALKQALEAARIPVAEVPGGIRILAYDRAARK
jgi:hypothetical protein